MSSTILSTSSAAAPKTPTSNLYGPIADFLLLGGGSLLVLPVIALAFPAPERPAVLAAVGLAFAHVINHPHFAHSYQLFYSGYFGKLTSPSLHYRLRLRYLFAGVVVPLLLAGYFGAAILAADPVMLGLAANLMTLLVGWHYVKQGYGMLIVDTVFKRRFFSPRQKWLLLANSYAVWVYAWMRGNAEIAAQDFWNLKYYTFDLPDWLMTGATVAMLAAAAGVAVMLARDLISRPGPRPWNGVIAYVTTLYLWTAFVTLNPAMLLLVPAFHSLQYLAVVWRFKLNAVNSDASAADLPAIRPFGVRLPRRGIVRLANFGLFGTLLGFIGFWGLPGYLDSVTAYDQAIFGPTLFIFVFWLFINVHHYFLDNVMWRGENPDVKRHLFAPH